MSNRAEMIGSKHARARGCPASAPRASRCRAPSNAPRKAAGVGPEALPGARVDVTDEVLSGAVKARHGGRAGVEARRSPRSGRRASRGVPCSCQYQVGCAGGTHRPGGRRRPRPPPAAARIPAAAPHVARTATRMPAQSHAPAVAIARSATRSVASCVPAEQPARELRATEEQRRVVLPGGADAAVDVDHRPGGEVQRRPGGRAGGAGGQRELLGRRAAGPAGVVLQTRGCSPDGAAPRSARA